MMDIQTRVAFPGPTVPSDAATFLKSRVPTMLLRVLTAVIALAPAMPAIANETLHSVVNVDLMPSKQAAGTPILTDYVEGARKDSTVLSATLVRQNGSLNHFILIQAFATRAAYDSHGEADYVRSFRSALYPYLGSPWDERVGVDITR